MLMDRTFRKDDDKNGFSMDAQHVGSSQKSWPKQGLGGTRNQERNLKIMELFGHRKHLPDGTRTSSTLTATL